MLNDPQIIARNRSELQKLKEERILEEGKVARLKKEAALLAEQKEDLEVERVLISQSHKQLRAEREEISAAQTKIQESIQAFEQEKIKHAHDIDIERRALEQTDRELEEQRAEINRSLEKLREEKVQWDRQKSFDIEQLKTAQAQYEQKRLREENEAFSRKKTMQAQEAFLNQKEELLSNRENQVRHLEEQTRNLDNQANQLLTSLEEIRSLEANFQIALSTFATEKETTLSEFEKTRFYLTEKEKELKLRESALVEKEEVWRDAQTQLEREQTEIFNLQNAHSQAVKEFEETQSKHRNELEVKEAQFTKMHGYLLQQKETLEKDQERLVEEWDSLEQMSSDFNEKSAAAESSLRERQKRITESETDNEIFEQKLNAWSQRLVNRNRLINAKQASLIKAINSLRGESTQLSIQKSLISRTQIKQRKEKMHNDIKHREIRKMAKRFIEITKE